jgi:general secretion pathway protein A
MYVEHYNLKSEPFRITPDPKFAWLGEKHAEALATLEYGIQQNKGFVVLTGDVGTGKTLIINCLLNRLDPNIIAVKVLNPRMAPVDFFNFVAAKLGWEKSFHTKGKFLLHFENYLYLVHAENKKVLLIVDEAHKLSEQVFQEIRLLSNIELEYEKLLNIFIVGQVELEKILGEDKNKALRERISVWYHIDPLTETEARQYISYRLGVAGSEVEIFKSDAIREIFLYSKGIPRLINILCDQALLTGLATDLKQIDGRVIKECAQDLRLFTFKNKRKQSAPKIAAKEALPADSLSPKRQISASYLFAVLSIILLIIIAYLVYNLRPWGNEDILSRHSKNYSESKAPAGTQKAFGLEETQGQIPEATYNQRQSRKNLKTEIKTGLKAETLQDIRENLNAESTAD